MTLNIPNRDRLISHLEGLPEEEFNMKYVYKRVHPCGTACCVSGHVRILTENASGLRSFLGLDSENAAVLGIMQPLGWSNETDSNKKYPLSRAIRTLKHMRAEFLRTGQVVVDWDAPEPAARKAWVAPQAVERVLPAEITKLLTTFDRVEVL